MIGAGKCLHAVFPCFGDTLVTMPQQSMVFHVDDCFYRRHLFGIQFLPDILIRKEQHAVRMMGQGCDTRWVEISQQRHCHTLIHIDIPKRHGPTGRVTRTEGHLTALGNSCLRKEESELFNVCSQLRIGIRLSAIVTECLLVPLCLDSVFQFFQIMFHLLSVSKNKNLSYKEKYRKRINGGYVNNHISSIRT